jgi:uncharacterized membrane protein HdeD (DUF308 family)
MYFPEKGAEHHMKFVRRAKWAYAIAAAVLIVMGVCLLIWPERPEQSICSILGIVFAVFGAVMLVCYFSPDRYGLAFQFDFALGLAALLAGIVMMVQNSRVVAIAPILVGAFIMIDGAFKLQTALDAKQFGLETWWLILAFALVTCACGLVLLLNPFDSKTSLADWQGVTLIVDGAQNLCIVIDTVKTRLRGAHRLKEE